MVVCQFSRRNYHDYPLVQINLVDHPLHQIVYFYIRKVIQVVCHIPMKIRIRKRSQRITPVDEIPKHRDHQQRIFEVKVRLHRVEKTFDFNYFRVHPMRLNNRFHPLNNHQEFSTNNPVFHLDDRVQKSSPIKRPAIVVNHYFVHHLHVMRYRNFPLLASNHLIPYERHYHLRNKPFFLHRCHLNLLFM